MDFDSFKSLSIFFIILPKSNCSIFIFLLFDKSKVTLVLAIDLKYFLSNEYLHKFDSNSKLLFSIYFFLKLTYILYLNLNTNDYL